MKNRTIIRALAKKGAEVSREYAQIIPDADLDCVVRERTWKDPINGLKPYIVQINADGYMYDFESQSDAECFQRDYRNFLGLTLEVA